MHEMCRLLALTVYCKWEDRYMWRHWWFQYPGQLLDIKFEFTLFIRAN